MLVLHLYSVLKKYLLYGFFLYHILQFCPMGRTKLQLFCLIYKTKYNFLAMKVYFKIAEH